MSSRVDPVFQARAQQLEERPGPGAGHGFAQRGRHRGQFTGSHPGHGALGEFLDGRVTAPDDVGESVAVAPAAQRVRPAVGRSPQRLAAADPRTGRLAIRGTYLWILDSDGISVLGKMRLRENTPPRIAFLGPDHVAAIDATGRAVVYGVTGGLRLQVVADLPAVCRDFVPLRGETAVLHQGGRAVPEARVLR